MLQAFDVSRTILFPAARPQAAIAAMAEAAGFGRHLPRHDLTQKSSPRPMATGLSFLDHLRQVSLQETGRR
jgi:hypothetical protein